MRRYPCDFIVPEREETSVLSVIPVFDFAVSLQADIAISESVGLYNSTNSSLALTPDT